MSLRKVLVTGATGFVGSVVVEHLLKLEGIAVLAGTRDAQRAWAPGVTPLLLPDLACHNSSMPPLLGIDTVVHCAARVHVMDERAADPLAEFRRVNVEGTLNLARRAAAAGVRRFIFISSIKVNGESTPVGHAFCPEHAPAPEDAYGRSKFEAEQGLRALARETGMEVVIIRPPLLYGPGVKGNFASMIQWLEWGLPLPLGAIPNKRSLLGLDNLADLIVRCLDHPAAANQVFLAADGEDLSTTELLGAVAQAMGRPARLIALPPALLRLGAGLLGRQAVAERLLGSLQVDIRQTCTLLGWRPPYTVAQGLRRCFSID